jgi:hypothetical protein
MEEDGSRVSTDLRLPHYRPLVWEGILHEKLSKPSLEMEYLFKKVTHFTLLGNCPN